jgi:hypothetical protein
MIMGIIIGLTFYSVKRGKDKFLSKNLLETYELLMNSDCWLATHTNKLKSKPKDGDYSGRTTILVVIRNASTMSILLT